VLVQTSSNPRKKRWSYDEYHTLGDNQRYEVIDGELLMLPAPDVQHQAWIRELTLGLGGFIKAHGLGQLLPSPIDVVLDTENIVQPDLTFVGRSALGTIGKKSVVGAPTLVVEVVSLSTIGVDRYKKRRLYARFGVAEFWVIDPGNAAVEVLVLNGQDYDLASVAAKQGRIRSSVLEGFEVEVGDLIPHL
jgi:Uma2 family endonuclease